MCIFHLQIVIRAKSNIFTCKFWAWLILIILFTRLLSYNSNSLTYKWARQAKSNIFTCKLCASLIFGILFTRLLCLTRIPSHTNLEREQSPTLSRTSSVTEDLMQICFSQEYSISQKKTIYLYDKKDTFIFLHQWHLTTENSCFMLNEPIL